MREGRRKEHRLEPEDRFEERVEEAGRKASHMDEMEEEERSAIRHASELRRIIYVAWSLGLFD